MTLALPLILDFDGTLQHSDLFFEGGLQLLRSAPLKALWMLCLLLRHGKVSAKLFLEEHMLAQGFIPSLPWDARVIEAAQQAQAQGRTVHIATGSPQMWVEAIVRAKGLDWPVLGTTQANGNLVGRRKAALLASLFTEAGFDYAGNSTADAPVWAAARGAWVANANAAATKVAGNHVLQTFPPLVDAKRAWLKALRPHQWLKNTLVFVPLMAAHLWLSVPDWGAALVAFIGFSLCASGAYVVNDLLDLTADRAHPRKRQRPFACGALPISQGLIAAGGLMLLGLGLSSLFAPALGAVVFIYLALTFAYSSYLKHRPVADAATLAALWGVRLWGGAVAIAVPLSQWLVLFAFLIFYSLALLKRYAELRDLPNRGQTQARGYLHTDAPLVAMQGTASGILAVLVVALYLNSPEVRMLYVAPQWLLPVCPILIWWIGRIWLLAHRDDMHDDPIVFAATDIPTWIAAAIVIGLALLGTGLGMGMGLR